MYRPLLLFIGLFIIGMVSVSLDYSAPSAPAVGPYLNGVFPESPPSENGTWELVDPLPGMTFLSPTRIIEFPGSSDILVLTKVGELWRVSLEDQTQKLVLDLKDRAFKRGEAGAVGVVFHPKFGDSSAPEKQQVFVFYRTKPNPDEWSELGFNRLSKFQWDAETATFDPTSEQILIQQYDRSTWHNGGAMFFAPDGFLYVSFGDEGAEDFQSISTQQLTGGIFSGIIRIDVDNDPNRSHPIRRQPRANQNPPNGWGTTYTQGYSIPNDNPWQNEDGSILEEFYAIGLRQPYVLSLDQETGVAWIADVGGAKQEEINHLEKGANYQWPYIEGGFDSEVHTRPENLIGQEKEAYFLFDRKVSSCIIGGGVYRGSLYPYLNGKYICADYNKNIIMALTQTGSHSEPELETLLNNLSAQEVEVPEKPGISGVYLIPDGRILVSVITKDKPGKIFELKKKLNSEVPEPPGRLSELGAFSDLENLTPTPGLIPYRVNAPLWSDRAFKRRWMALPNGGTSGKIQFSSTQTWTFPEGTVFVKHFELPITTDLQGPTEKLETRFFIVGKGGKGYGLTYKWNSEGTDAILLGGGATANFTITENGNPAYTQTWDYPSREQCLTCHNGSANYVLGLQTHQLNGDLYYPELGRTMNQLTYFNEIEVFQRDIGAPGGYLKAHPIEDESVDLELRIRSYFDANCASCHRPGGVPALEMDMRFNNPLQALNILDWPTQSHASEPNRLIVQPGSHQASELWVRDASEQENRMPPLGKQS